MAEKAIIAKIHGHDIDTTVIEPSGTPKGAALFLHGAGESTKDRCLPLARALAKHGYRAITFSFHGHGNSSGSLLGSTLAERQAVAEAIGQKFDVFPADIIVAVSMGGHTAIQMLGDNPSLTQKLALFAPAIYAKEAEHKPFGPAFSEVIRKPQSYLTSKAWDILPSYKGKLVTVQAGADEVIPPEVIDLIHQKSTQAEKQRFLIPGIPHRVTVWLSEKPGRLDAMAEALDTFDFSGLGAVI